MKKTTAVILLLLSLFVTQVSAYKIDYFPQYSPGYAQKLRTENYGDAVVTPDGYPGSTAKWPVMIFIHGMGDPNDGLKENLDNILFGYDYDGPSGPAGRVNAPVATDMLKAVDRDGIVLIVVGYNSAKTFFNPSMCASVYNLRYAQYRLQERWAWYGFSYGAGAVIRFAKDPLSAGKIALAAPVAPTNEGGGSWTNSTAGAGVVLLVGVNVGDNNGATSLGVTQGIVKAFNDSKPAVIGQYIAFNATGHGGTNEFYTATPPVAPKGQGVTDAAESVYQLHKAIVATGNRQIRTGTPVDTIPTTPPVVTLVADFDLTTGQVVTTSTLALDGSKSLGVASGNWKYFWTLSPSDGNYVGFTAQVKDNGTARPTITGLKNGTYKVTLTVFDAVNKEASRSAIITAAVSGKVPIGYDGTSLLFSDGTKQSATIKWDGLKFVATTSTQTFNL